MRILQQNLQNLGFRLRSSAIAVPLLVAAEICNFLQNAFAGDAHLPAAPQIKSVAGAKKFE
jgi:hypothetical protein